MTITTGAKYGKIMKESAEAGIMTGFTGMTVILLGGVAVAGVTKNVACLVRNRIRDKKEAAQVISDVKAMTNTKEA